MAKAHVTITTKKRFALEVKVMTNIILCIALFSETKAERLFELYTQYLGNNINKYIEIK